METYERIKQLRMQAGLSQSELAKKAGYTDRSSIAKIEAGLVDLSETKLVKLAVALGVDMQYLLGLSVDSQIDALKYEINEIEKELIQEDNGEVKESLEAELDVKRESYEDLVLIRNLKSLEPDPAPSIPPERQALIDELMKCSDEELKAMLKIAEMLKGK